MNNYKERLNKLESIINDRKLELAKLEQQKSTAKEEEVKLLSEFKERGVPDIDKLTPIIAQQKIDIESAFKKIDKELNV